MRKTKAPAAVGIIAFFFAIWTPMPVCVAADAQQAISPLTRIQPVVGLVITSTVHSSFGSAEASTVHNYAALDT